MSKKRKHGRKLPFCLTRIYRRRKEMPINSKIGIKTVKRMRMSKWRDAAKQLEKPAIKKKNVEVPSLFDGRLMEISRSTIPPSTPYDSDSMPHEQVRGKYISYNYF